MAMELDKRRIPSSISYDIVEASLGPSSPSTLFHPDFISDQEHSVEEALVLRRIVDDNLIQGAEGGGGGGGGEEEEEEEEAEVEYISLSIDGDDEGCKEEDKERSDGFILPSPVLPTSNDSILLENPPWYQLGLRRPISIRSPLLELHQEILDFCDLISPTQLEQQSRAMAVQRVSNVIKSIWKQCQVVVFGSFATGLYLPTSDIDIVILDSGCCDTQSGLKAISKALTKEGVAKSIQVIGKARVPIVKFVESGSLVSFDVSFDMLNGPDAARFIQEALKAVPPLKPLCMVVKIFLQQRDLNEVYSGGIGSYALLVMLLGYLQAHARKLSHGHAQEQIRLEQNLGVLLVEFFEFYGRSLNIKDVGISCRDGGHFFKKKERGFFDSRKPFMLTVEDPQAPSSDIAKSSFNFQKVRFAFMLAHRALTDLNFNEKKLGAGLLSRIVRVDEKLAGRKNMIGLVSEGRKQSYWSHLSSDMSSHGHDNQLDQYSVTEERAFPRGTNLEQEKVKKKFMKKNKRKNKELHSPKDNTVKKKRKKVWKNKEEYFLEEREQRKESNSRRKFFFKKKKKQS